MTEEQIQAEVERARAIRDKYLEAHPEKKPAFAFEVTKEQAEKAREFAKAIDQKVWDEQVAKCRNCKRNKHDLCYMHRTGPYYGAIGGSLTWSFTPTSIGIMVTVKHGMTGDELFLSDDL